MRCMVTESAMHGQFSPSNLQGSALSRVLAAVESCCMKTADSMLRISVHGDKADSNLDRHEHKKLFIFMIPYRINAGLKAIATNTSF